MTGPHCSEGWIRDLFRRVSGREVAVEATETILRGGPKCRFSVALDASLDDALR